MEGVVNFNLATPCKDCPFLREGGIRLRRERTLEIANTATGEPGGPFVCHKTLNEDGREIKESSQCAGALAFAVNVDRFSNYLRIIGRLGLWSPDRIRNRETVYASMREILAGSLKR